MPDRGSFGLTYALTECRCGARRLAARPCGDCGAAPQPYEFDPHVQRRARLRRDVLQVLSVTTVEALKSEGPLDLMITAFSSMEGWLTRLWSILNKNRPKVEVVTEHVDKLRALRLALGE